MSAEVTAARQQADATVPVGVRIAALLVPLVKFPDLHKQIAEVYDNFKKYLFDSLFMLIDGKGIWAWVVRLFPPKARPAIDGSGRAGWVTLTNFVRVQIFVACVDAVGIGLGAWIIGLFFGGFPLVIPITVAVFLGSFIPVPGALFAVPVVSALNVMVEFVASGQWRTIPQPTLTQAERPAARTRVETNA